MTRKAPIEIDDAKQYRITLKRAIRGPHGVMLPPGDPKVRVAGRVLRQILDDVEGAPVAID